MMKFSISFIVEISRNGSTEEPKSWEFLRKRVRKRDNSTCRYCGKFVLDGHVDHIIPISHGGASDLDNLAWSCPDCNHSKGDRTPEEWGVEISDSASCMKIEISEPEKPSRQFGLPIGQDVLCQIATAVLEESRNFSRRSLSDIISESQFDKLLGVMLKEGLVEYKSDRPQAGTKLTYRGKALLQELLVIN